MLCQDIKLLRPFERRNLDCLLPNEHECKMALIRNVVVRGEIHIHSDGQRIFGRQSVLVGLEQANHPGIKG